MDIDRWKAPAALWTLLLLFAACADRVVPDAASPSPAGRESATATTPVAAPVQAAPPSAASAAPGAAGPVPAAGAIGYRGFGPAAYGGSVEPLRMAWGKDLDGAPSAPGGCHYLTPVGGSGIAFMVEGDAFVRTDVSRADVEAPGGGRVGVHADAIRSRHGAAVDVHPHEVVDGARLLRIADPSGGAGVLLFETDANGVVVAWRTGIAPQVDYSEGCS